MYIRASTSSLLFLKSQKMVARGGGARAGRGRRGARSNKSCLSQAKPLRGSSVGSAAAVGWAERRKQNMVEIVVYLQKIWWCGERGGTGQREGKGCKERCGVNADARSSFRAVFIYS